MKIPRPWFLRHSRPPSARDAVVSKELSVAVKSPVKNWQLLESRNWMKIRKLKPVLFGLILSHNESPVFWLDLTTADHLLLKPYGPYGPYDMVPGRWGIVPHYGPFLVTHAVVHDGEILNSQKWNELIITIHFLVIWNINH